MVNIYIHIYIYIDRYIYILNNICIYVHLSIIYIYIYIYTVKFLIFRTLYFASGRFENALPAKLWISKSYIWRVGGPEMPCEPITKMAISRQIYSRKRFWLVHSKALGEIYNFGKTKIPWYIEHANRRARINLDIWNVLYFANRSGQNALPAKFHIWKPYIWKVPQKWLPHEI